MVWVMCVGHVGCDAHGVRWVRWVVGVMSGVCGMCDVITGD